MTQMHDVPSDGVGLTAWVQQGTIKPALGTSFSSSTLSFMVVGKQVSLFICPDFSSF